MKYPIPAGATFVTIPDPVTPIPVFDTGTPVNQPPVVNAGNDVILLPTDVEVTLKATGRDPDGTSTTYKWVKVSGPTGQTIVTPNSPQTKITGLVKGVYVFKATIMDAAGASTYDLVTVTKPDVIVVPPPPPTGTFVVEGHGKITAGGEGKQIIELTGLDANALLNAIGSNRTVRFQKGGIIENFRSEFSGLSNFTLDGNTADGVGITLNNGSRGGNVLSFDNNCHDFIIKNIRTRGAGNDGINVVDGYNFVFDHCSTSGNEDGGLDLTAGARNGTVQWCILGKEGNGGSGAMLLAYAGTKDISVHHNLFSSFERNPMVHRANNFQPTNTEDLMCDLACNLIWNYTNYGSSPDYGGTMQARNNYYMKGGNAILLNRESSGAKLFASGNVAKDGVNIGGGNHSEWTLPAIAKITMQAAKEAAVLVLAGAGCRSLDSVDQAFINSIKL